MSGIHFLGRYISIKGIKLVEKSELYPQFRITNRNKLRKTNFRSLGRMYIQFSQKMLEWNKNSRNSSTLINLTFAYKLLLTQFNSKAQLCAFVDISSAASPSVFQQHY